LANAENGGRGSKNASAALVGFQSIELEVLGEATAELSQPNEQLTRRRGLVNLERARAGHMDLDTVAFLESQGIDDGRRYS